MIHLALIFKASAGYLRKSWTVISGILALAVIAGLAMALHGQRRLAPSAPSLTNSQPAPPAQPPIEQPYYVLVWIESKPPGARIVLLSNGFVLGRTPETVEFRQSKEPVPIRIELQGYVSVTRDVSAVTDSTLTVVLKPR